MAGGLQGVGMASSIIALIIMHSVYVLCDWGLVSVADSEARPPTSQ